MYNKKDYLCTKNLESGKTYKYKVRAIKGKKKSLFSKIAKVTTIGRNAIIINSNVKGTKVTLTWNKVKNASGYLIFRSQYGQYIKIGETNNTVFKNNTGLELSTEYSYKVVPFIINNGKKIRGSVATKIINTEKTDYFLDIISPYEKPYWYEAHTDTVFKMGGVNYNHGFTCMGYGESDEGNQGNVTYFNLHGNYAKLSFDAGIVDGGERNDANVYVYNDGILKKTFEIKANSLPRHYDIDVKNCVQLKICVYSGRWVAMYDSTYGFGNMIISK